MIAGSNVTSAILVITLTLATSTPAVLRNAVSMVAEHAAHVIPVIAIRHVLVAGAARAPVIVPPNR
jgi:hypothetical protein